MSPPPSTASQLLQRGDAPQLRGQLRQLVVVEGQGDEQHRVDYLGLLVASSEDHQEVLPVLGLSHDHLVVEPALQPVAFPPRLLAVQVEPVDLIDHLLGLIQAPVDHVELVEDAGGVVFSGLDVES